MKTSCIQHAHNDHFIMIRQSYVALCDGNHCAAALLSFMEGWHNHRLEQIPKANYQNALAQASGEEGTQDTSLLQFHNDRDFSEGLCGLFGRETIRKALRLLTEKGCITIHKNPNPRYAFDATRYILFHAERVQHLLHLPKMAHPSAENGTRSAENSQPSAENSQSSRASSGASNLRNPESFPKILSEIPSETLEPPKAPQMGGMLSQGEYRIPALKTETVNVKTKKPHSKDYTPGFLAWWRAYPPSRRLDKPSCFAVWQREQLESRASELLEKLERLKETTWKHTDPHYIKTSLPYLNGGRYDDDLLPLPDMPTQQESGFSEQGYQSALASLKVMEDLAYDDARKQAALLSSADADG